MYKKCHVFESLTLWAKGGGGGGGEYITVLYGMYLHCS